MTYPETVEYLYSLRWHGTKLGLEHTLELAALLGNPHRDLRFIHVAGTNGKGSTCAMLESIYRAAGLKVGLFTSPHLVAFAERIQVNRTLIPDADVVRLVEWMRPALARFSTDAHPTFFEVVTVLALRYFVEQQCDLVIWETGLGGRLDATNIVTPLASVITNIQYDHEKWLGSTLEQIAFEKAGILKPGVPAVTGTEAPGALRVIQARAAELGAPLSMVLPGDESGLEGVMLPLLGNHQRRNAAVALATVRRLQSLIPVTPEAVVAGLEQVYWPGRMQLVQPSPHQRVVLDGAHNPDGVESFIQALHTEFPGQKPALIVGILADKHWEQMCARLSEVAARILVVPVSTERTAPPAALAEACGHRQLPVEACPNLAAAFERARQVSLIGVVGSLYLVGEAMEYLGLSQVRPTERTLNDWGGPRG